MGPSLRVNDDRTTAHFLVFQPLAVFDSLLTDAANITMTQWAAGFSDASTVIMDIESEEEMHIAQTELLKQVKNNKACIELARSPKLVIRLSNNLTLRIVSQQWNGPQVDFLVRNDGSDKRRVNTGEILMSIAAYTSKKESITSLLLRSDSDATFGPRTLQLMEMLGYETVHSEKPKYSGSVYSVMESDGYDVKPVDEFMYDPAKAGGVAAGDKKRASSNETTRKPKRAKN